MSTTATDKHLRLPAPDAWKSIRGRTLAQAHEQAAILLRPTLEVAIVDKGYEVSPSMASASTT